MNKVGCEDVDGEGFEPNSARRMHNKRQLLIEETNGMQSDNCFTKNEPAVKPVIIDPQSELGNLEEMALIKS